MAAIPRLPLLLFLLSRKVDVVVVLAVMISDPSFLFQFFSWFTPPNSGRQDLFCQSLSYYGTFRLNRRPLYSFPNKSCQGRCRDCYTKGTKFADVQIRPYVNWFFSILGDWYPRNGFQSMKPVGGGSRRTIASQERFPKDSQRGKGESWQIESCTSPAFEPLLFKSSPKVQEISCLPILLLVPLPKQDASAIPTTRTTDK